MSVVMLVELRAEKSLYLHKLPDSPPFFPGKKCLVARSARLRSRALAGLTYVGVLRVIDDTLLLLLARNVPAKLSLLKFT